MSRGKWKRSPDTGISLKQLARVDEEYLTADGRVNVSIYSDSNVFDVRSFAALAGFRDWKYFRDVVLPRSGSPFHYHELILRDPEGRFVARVYMTHQNSAYAGGLMGRAAIGDRARGRMREERARFTLIGEGN